MNDSDPERRAGSSARLPYRLVGFDLDDTLYPEVEYVRSGYAEVARRIAGITGAPAEKVFERLWRLFQHGDRRRVFDAVLAELGDPGALSVPALVELYRSHAPDIRLQPAVADLLETLRAAGLRLAVVTDGPVGQQQRKVEALGLARLVDEILFTDALPPGSAKPSPAAFEQLMCRFDVRPEQCVYVADNPRKDFIGPRQLGWFTIRLVRPDGVYCREPAPPGGQPHVTVADLPEILRYAFARTVG
jgi:putative hydrolase of the HAD superfamily